MASQHGRNYFQLTAKQTTNLASTNSTTLRAFPIVLPPLAEQQATLDEIREQTTGVEAVIDRSQREISLLREYRTRLIVDVVTGKLDVREAAAKLPDKDPLGAGESLADDNSSDSLTAIDDEPIDDFDADHEESAA
jgi:type I restriction enzyme S subunit